MCLWTQANAAADGRQQRHVDRYDRGKSPGNFHHGRTPRNQFFLTNILINIILSYLTTCIQHISMNS